MAQTSLINEFISCIIHLCYGFIYLKNQIICPQKRLSHSPKRFILFMKWQHLFAIFACRCLHFAQTDLKSLQNEHHFLFVRPRFEPWVPDTIEKNRNISLTGIGGDTRPAQWKTTYCWQHMVDCDCKWPNGDHVIIFYIISIAYKSVQVVRIS